MAQFANMWNDINMEKLIKMYGSERAIELGQQLEAGGLSSEELADLNDYIKSLEDKSVIGFKKDVVNMFSNRTIDNNNDLYSQRANYSIEEIEAMFDNL